MNGKHQILGFALGLVLLSPSVLGIEDVVIRARLFRATFGEDHTGLKQEVILTSSSDLRLAALKAKAEGPESEFAAAVIETLVDLMHLRAVDDLFSFSKTWNESVSRLSETVILEREAFLFIFTPKRLSAQKVGLKTELFKTRDTFVFPPERESLHLELLEALRTDKDQEKLEKILDRELTLESCDPVIIGVPGETGTHFLLIMIKSGPEVQGPPVFSGGTKAVHKVMPSYPIELRQQGVEGQVGLQVAVDEDGTVQGIRIVKSLHPYLDNAAVQALKQWKFEPLFYDGKPVAAMIAMTVNFTRETWRLQEETPETGEALLPGSESSSQEELWMILDRCAEYCRKLAESALDYICEETIRDVFYNFHDRESLEKSGVVLSMVSGIDGSVSRFEQSFVPIRDLRRTERNEYVCDYLLVKKGDRIEDKRILLEENGRKVPGRDRFLEEKRFSALMPLLVPDRLLGRDRQSLFAYRILKEERIKGKKAYVIEALPRSGDAGGIEYGKIWVEKRTYQVLKAEVEGVPLEGYENVLVETAEHNMKPRFTTTYLYRVEKNGLMFPSQIDIKVGYPYPGSSARSYLKKIRTDVEYDKYKFFTVKTETEVKK
jgi:TonB family protein